MLATFIVAGICISEDRRHYWKYAIWPVIAFTLVLGLRLNRGNDYIHYMQVYLYDLEDDQVLFTAFNHFLKAIGTGPHWIFIWYSGAFVLGAMFFLRSLRQYANWIFPLFLISFTFFSEYMIRQAFGYTFVFLFMAFMFSEEMPKVKRWTCMAVCFWLAYNIHSANAITCVTSCGLYYFVRFPFKAIYAIPLYLVATFYLQKNFDFSYLNGILSFLGDQNDKFSGYTENSDAWFSQDAMNANYDRKPLVKVLQTMGDCSLIYLTNYTLSKYNDKRFLYMYNTFVVGAIVSQCFYSLEILRRMGDTMYWYWAFCLSFVLHYRTKILQLGKRQFVLKACYLMMFFYVYDYLKYLFLREEMYHFLWDL